jgi:hypothetical protein
MHGVAPRMCGQVVLASLGGGAGGRSPGSIYADTAVEKVRLSANLLTKDEATGGQLRQAAGAVATEGLKADGVKARPAAHSGPRMTEGPL